MSSTQDDFIQLLNTAIVKTKEKKIDANYENRLVDVCNSNAIKALDIAASHLSDLDGITRDQATIRLVDAVRNLDSIWSDYIMMEGLSKLKGQLGHREFPQDKTL